MTIPHLRPMRSEDVDAVAALEQAVYERPWSAQLFRDELERPGRCYLTAWSAAAPTGHGTDALLGYGGVLDAVGEAHITTVVVTPTARRRGVASHLVLGLLDAARQMGCGAATLEVRAGNRGAQRLYAGFGFAPVGVRPGYYAPTGEDAIIMWAYDIDGSAFGGRLDRARDRIGAKAAARSAGSAGVR
jgi:[ribosomal protein S18]-alanine N-acetyltransferase